MKYEIIFFDATEARRERMRSGGARTKAEPRKTVSDEVVKSDASQPSSAPSGDVPKTTPAIVEKPAPAKSEISMSELDAYLVNFVVEQTGYPEDMVDLDADLEGDLGIDSIKKAQLLGELNEKFHFSTADDMNGTTSLDDFATLRSIRDFIVERTGASPATSPSAAPAAASVPSESAEPEPTTSYVSAGVSSDELDAYLVNFVVEQTGYPEDMVDLDADLEGDLGIDSIKKAQLLGELNEKFHFSTTDDMNGTTSLDDFATLRSIRDFIVERTGASPAASSAAPAAASVPSESAEPEPTTSYVSAGVSSDELDAYLVNFVVEQTGYPEDMVDLDADLEGDLGIDSIKKAQLLGELNEKFRFSTADDMSGATSFDDFATLRSIRDFIVKRLEDAPAPSLQEEASSFSSEDSIENNRKEIADYLTRFVADQTGYPESMISLDLDLGTDLGIDSIKKAQLFAEIAEMYSAYPLASQSLEDFNTLGQIYEAVVKEL